MFTSATSYTPLTRFCGRTAVAPEPYSKKGATHRPVYIVELLLKLGAYKSVKVARWVILNVLVYLLTWLQDKVRSSIQTSRYGELLGMHERKLITTKRIVVRSVILAISLLHWVLRRLVIANGCWIIAMPIYLPIADALSGSHRVWGQFYVWIRGRSICRIDSRVVLLLHLFCCQAYLDWVVLLWLLKDDTLPGTGG